MFDVSPETKQKAIEAVVAVLKKHKCQVPDAHVLQEALDAAEKAIKEGFSFF